MKFFALECAPLGAKPFEYNLRIGGYISFNRALHEIKKRGNGFIINENREILVIVRRGRITHDLRTR
jgi:hypothetical protein